MQPGANRLIPPLNRCFGHDTIEAILSALAEEGTPWAKRTIQTLQERSPTAVRVTLRQMRLGRRWSIAEAFQREYHIAGKMMDHPDFVEGVSARLIRKPAEIPKWQPTSLESANDVDTESFFKVEGEQKLQLININSEVGDYHEYPHGWLNLPSERDIEFVVREGQKTASEVIEHFVEVRRGKAGVREKVSEVLARKTRAAEDHGSNLSWISST
jgi:3-hydroxyisobutyryl-CoA hydrolase